MAAHPGSAGHTAKHVGTSKHRTTHKHHPKHAALTPAQHQARHNAAVKAAHTRKVNKARKASDTDVQNCAAVALAASLALTGVNVTDEQALDLYWKITSDPNSGASILDTLRACSVYGLAGWYPEFREVDEPTTGSILGYTLTNDVTHAVAYDAPGIWSWGEWIPVDEDFLEDMEEIWEVTWHE